MNKPIHQPPKWADRLLEWFCAPHLHEEVQGDLHELYAKWVDELGEKRANRRYILNVVGFLRPFALKRNPNPHSTYLNPTDMLYNYLIIAFRNLRRQAVFSGINIMGLAIGMASSFLILLWVQHERSHDRFHTHASDIYRVNANISDVQAALSCPPMAPALVRQIPDIQNAVRLNPTKNLFEVDTRKFEEKDGYYADSTFFDLFSFPFVAGNPQTALNRPNAIVLTEALAQKYFGSEKALGKTLRMDNTHTFTVTGVLENPRNSHLPFKYLLPMTFLGKHLEDLTKWGNFGFYTYVQLREGTDPAARQQIVKQIDAIFAENEKEYTATFDLQPVTEIYLADALFADTPWHGNRQYVQIFSIVAVCILVIAGINFMNLATARSAHRAKEVGVRKVIGANRRQLIGQFMGESVLISLLALVVAALLAWLLLPAFNTLSGTELTIPVSASVIGGALMIALLTGIVSGSYPALFLSAFQPVQVLKGTLARTRRGAFLRNSLVVLQFTTSIVLLVGTAGVYVQLQYLRNKHLGFNKENLLHVPIRGDLHQHTAALRGELAQHPLTRNFSVVSELPVNAIGGNDVQWEGKDPDKQVLFSSMNTDEHFLHVFGMELRSGREFAPGFNDSASYIVNEAALRVMGMDTESAIGKFFSSEPDGKIIGVVKDFNFRPLHHRVEPLVIGYLTSGHGQVVIRTQPSTTEATTQALEQIFRKLNPAYPFSFAFLDQDIDKLYRTEQRMSGIANVLAALAIFVSCLGLYGLAAFTAEQRTKEIGIRKVMGASAGNITYLLSKEFMRLVLIAFVVAAPIAWYAMRKWLENFAYRIELAWWMFALAGGLAVTIALLTVSYQAIKAARANPVDSLRRE